MTQNFLDYSNLSQSDVDKLFAQLEQYASSLINQIPTSTCEFFIDDELLSKIELPDKCKITKKY